MKFKFLRLIAFLVLIIFSFNQIIFAYPLTAISIQSSALSVQQTAVSDLQAAAISATQMAGPSRQVKGRQVGGQAALLALNFIPGVGSVLSGALQFLFQGFLAVGKFLLGSLAQLAGAAFSGLGQFLGSSLLSTVGGSLRGLGSSLIQGARSFFQTGMKDLIKSITQQSFSFKQFFNKSLGNISNQLNSLTSYKSILPDGVRLYPRIYGKRRRTVSQTSQIRSRVRARGRLQNSLVKWFMALDFR